VVEGVESDDATASVGPWFARFVLLTVSYIHVQYLTPFDTFLAFRKSYLSNRDGACSPFVIITLQLEDAVHIGKHARKKRMGERVREREPTL